MKRFLTISLAAVGVLLAALSVFSEAPNIIHYEGFLTDADGMVVVGPHDVTFRIYTGPSEGDVLWEESHAGIDIQDGFFSVMLGSRHPIHGRLFDDGERWLGISVDSDPEMTPRVRVASVPWALRAVVADTARVLAGPGDHDHSDCPTKDMLGSPGVFNDPTNPVDWTKLKNVPVGTSGGGRDMLGQGDGHSLDAADGDPVDVVYVDDDGAVSVGVDGTGYEVNMHGSTSGGRLFWEPTAMSLRVGGENDGSWDPGNLGQYSFAAGFNTKATSVFSTATGNATTASGQSSTAMGCLTIASGNISTAIGHSSTASGNYSIAMGRFADADEWYATAIGGRNAVASGVQSMALGSYTTAAGENSVAMGYNAVANGMYSAAIGTYATANAEDSYVMGSGTYSGQLVNSVPHSLMVGFASDEPMLFVGGSQQRVGIGTSNPAAKLDVVGRIRISNATTGKAVLEMGEGLDYAEGFYVSCNRGIEPGTVLIIDPDNPGTLNVSTEPYDNKVAGIVAGANGLGSGVRLGASQFDCNVALAGRVYCNVDATVRGVEPGDLLTTSSTPGYAMKVSDAGRANGAILGKAMQRLEKGKKGQILVLVTLQ